MAELAANIIYTKYFEYKKQNHKITLVMKITLHSLRVIETKVTMSSWKNELHININ